MALVVKYWGHRGDKGFGGRPEVPTDCRKRR